MIFITEKYCKFSERLERNNLWEIKNAPADVRASYGLFLREKADEIKIVINPHWFNIMNRKDHHPELSEEEYRTKEKQWKKILRQWNIDKYIADVLKGHKLDYKII